MNVTCLRCSRTAMKTPPISTSNRCPTNSVMLFFLPVSPPLPRLQTVQETPAQTHRSLTSRFLLATSHDCLSNMTSHWLNECELVSFKLLKMLFQSECSTYNSDLVLNSMQIVKLDWPSMSLKLLGSVSSSIQFKLNI